MIATYFREFIECATALYTITLLVLVCPDLLNSVEDASYGIRGVVHRTTVSTICLLIN
jgi:hypothetical protein